MLIQTSSWSTTRTSLAMPSGLRLRSSLSGSGRTSLNWSQTPNWSQLQQLKRREERTWRRRVGVEPTIYSSAVDGVPRRPTVGDGALATSLKVKRLNYFCGSQAIEGTGTCSTET